MRTVAEKSDLHPKSKKMLQKIEEFLIECQKAKKTGATRLKINFNNGIPSTLHELEENRKNIPL